MKLPSLASLVHVAADTVRRFPLAITLALAGSVFGLLLVYTDHHFWYWNALKSCYLGMLLQVALVTLGERKGRKGLAQLAGAIVTLGYYVSLPWYFREVDLVRFFLFTIGLHGLISFIALLGKNGFWQFNKALFLRILLSALYTGVLYAGLALALLAVDKLSLAAVPGQWYGYLWVGLTGLFNTWFFLAGYPSDYARLEAETDYPRGLKVFTQYLLLPLLTVYAAILYIYTVKIIATGQWPEGWVAYLVLGFSVAGILSLLLIYPIRHETANRWILGFSRLFYVALLPLVVLLFAAIRKRVVAYGITELRYMVMLLAVWLLTLSLYFLFARKKNIKVIPVSLCLLAFLVSFGPWSAFAVSRYSQLLRWTRQLKIDHLLVDGKVVRQRGPISFEDRKRISATTDYLVETYGYKTIAPYFAQNLDSLLRRDSIASSDRNVYQRDTILALMGLTYIYYGAVNEYRDEDIEYRLSDKDAPVSITGYDYLVKDYTPESDNGCTTYRLGADSVDFCFDSASHRISFRYQGLPALVLDMDSIYRSLHYKADSTEELSLSSMTVDAGIPAASYRLVFQNIDGWRTDSTYRVRDFRVDVLIGLKR